MIPNGSSVRVVVSGRYGAFSGINAESDISQQLNNDGYVVVAWTDNDPSILSQVLEGDFLSRPYQTTLDLQVGRDYNGVSEIASEVGAAFAQGLRNTMPSAVAVTQVNGSSTGQIQDQASYGLGQLGGGVKDVLEPIGNKIETILIVAVVGIVLVLIFAPKTVRAITG